MKKANTKVGVKGPMAMDTMVIAHQDGDLVYKLEEGGYSVVDNRISISVETEATKKDQFPACASIAIGQHPLTGPLRVGDTFECIGGMANNPEDGSTEAYGYFTFHAEEISVRWKVESIETDIVVFSLEAKHDDVNYYDKRAKRTPTQGLFKLSHKPLSKLWIPS